MTDAVRVFRCGAAARWLPRATAAAVVVATLLVAFRFETVGMRVAGFPVQAFFAVVGALAALWVLRSGAELRVVVGLHADGVELAYGKRRTRIPFAKLERFEFDAPMSASRRPIPATALVEESGRAWRLPAVLRDGDTLIAGIVQRAGREDLAAWAESLRLERRMGRAGVIVAIGYALAAAIVLAGAVFYARGAV